MKICVLSTLDAANADLSTTERVFDQQHRNTTNFLISLRKPSRLAAMSWRLSPAQCTSAKILIGIGIVNNLPQSSSQSAHRLQSADRSKARCAPAASGFEIDGLMQSARMPPGTGVSRHILSLKSRTEPLANHGHFAWCLSSSIALTTRRCYVLLIANPLTLSSYAPCQSPLRATHAAASPVGCHTTGAAALGIGISPSFAGAWLW